MLAKRSCSSLSRKNVRNESICGISSLNGDPWARYWPLPTWIDAVHDVSVTNPPLGLLLTTCIAPAFQTRAPWSQKVIMRYYTPLSLLLNA